MSYAKRKDGQGWRSVNSPADVSSDETFIEQAPGAITLSNADLTKQQIVLLEASITNRRLREAILGVDNGWLANVNQQIADLRAQLT